MFKRARWMSIGAAVGFGGSVWAQRRVRRTVERYLPDQVVAQAGHKARNLRSDVADAIAEGRAAMRARENELRDQLEGRPGPELGPAPDGMLPGVDGHEVMDVEELLAHRSMAIDPPARPHRGRRARRT